MLYSLHVENMAVIRSADIDFHRGFSAITGETGAGKSVMIAGISLLMGGKAERDIIRTGEVQAQVSGLFGDISAAALAQLAELGVYPDEEGNILVQRTVSREAPSQVRMNGRSVSLATLKTVMPEMLSIHGQNDTHALADPESHCVLLDLYAENAEYLKAYREQYEIYERTRRETEALKGQMHERERRMEMLRYQLQDIDAISPKDGEEEELVDRKVRLKSSERIRKHADFAFRALKGSEKGSVAYLLDRTATALSQIADVVTPCADYAERLRDMLYQVSDIAEEVYAVQEELEGEGREDINDIEERLDKLSRLKRKYGLTLADVIAYKDGAEAELYELEHAEDRIEELETRLRAVYADAVQKALVLHERRAAAAKQLETLIKDTLSFLDMPKVVFFASIKEEYKGGERVLLPNGCDRIEFFISANSGADPQPMAKIASGGELARVMLALKCALADKQSVRTLIFDEIDAGVSGKTARKIGMKLRELAGEVQVICVTHSAQIASLSDAHFLIRKTDEGGSTQTHIHALDREGRLAELSRILGGLEVTAAQRRAAEDMLLATDAEA